MIIPTSDVLASSALESLFYGIALGVALTIVVSIAQKIFGPLNAATRSVIWFTTLAVLPLIPVLYFATHLPSRKGAPDAVVHRVSVRKATHDLPFAPAVVSSKPESPAKTSAAPMPASHRFNIALPEHFFEGLLGLYITVVVALFLRLSVSYLRLCLVRRRTQAPPDELPVRLEQWLKRCPTTRPVKLRVSNRAHSPVALGFRTPYIVMPTHLVLELSQEEYDDLGVHELAHIRRYDDWWNLAQRLLRAVLFFHPAAHYISRKLDLEREFACDDWVVSSHESKSYAQCLAKIVELRRYHRGALLLSSGALFGKRQIIKRVEALLDRTRNSATSVSGLAIALIAVAIVVVATQVVDLPAVVAFTQDANNSTSFRETDEGRDLRIKLRGEINFSPDDQIVTGVSPSGFITIDESKGWSRRRLEVRPGSTGAPEERYFLDGREKPMDGVGRAWAAGMYLFAIRELGLDAENRVNCLLSRRGPSAVLAEIDLIHSDRVKREYLTKLLDQATLSSFELERVNDSVRKISSDNDKADFLIAHEHDLMTDQLRSSYFRAVNSVRSDSDKRRILIHLLETEGRDTETARLIGLSAKEMSSDSDKADVLLAIPSEGAGQASCALLTAARNIQSDRDKARVLHDAAYIESTECREAYFAVVNLIQSDGDRAGVLQNLLANTSLDPETYLDIAGSAKAIKSDNDKARVLVALSSRYTELPFFDAVNTIESSNDRTRVLKSVLEHSPSTAAVLEVIGSASTLPAENEKADVLLGIAKHSNDPEIRSALQHACEKLGSDNDYRRVASAIFEYSEASNNGDKLVVR